MIGEKKVFSNKKRKKNSTFASNKMGRVGEVKLKVKNKIVKSKISSK